MRWNVAREAGAAVDLHSRDLGVEPGERRALFFEVDAPTLVLGSAQPIDDVDASVAAAAGIEVVHRRSGGGAVLLVPDEHVWVDIVIGRDDPLWTDDVSTSSRWLGGAWAGALGELVDEETAVHRAPLVHDHYSDMICFSALAPGEVTVGTAKAVGISQRRTRAAARFQCVVLRAFDVDLMMRLFDLEPAEAWALDVHPVDVPADAIRDALVRHLQAVPGDG